MARVAMVRGKDDATTQRRNGVEGFRHVAHDVKHISRIQMDDALLERLGQGAARHPAAERPPDFVFYTGCNVLKTPHIALLALDIMDALGASYEVMGGPTHCCGVQPMRSGDTATFGRVAESHARQDGAKQDWPGGVVVSGLPRQFHRTDAADR